MPWTSGYGHLARVFDCSFSPSGGQILTASEDKTARVWSVCDRTIQQVACLTGHSEEVLRASWHRDETLVATGSADQTARIWKVRPDYGSECLSVLAGHEEELYCAEWVRTHDKSLLTASGKTVALWDISEGKKFSEAQLVSSSVADNIPSVWRDLALFDCEQSPTAPTAACPCSDGTVHIVSLQGNAVKPIHCINVAGDLESPSMCTSAAFSTDGKRLAVSTSGCMVAVYDTATWKVLSQLDLDETVRSCRWYSMDGKQLLYVVAGASVLCYDPVTGAAFTKHSQWPSRMLLTVGLSQTASTGSAADPYIVASGEVVPEPCRVQPMGCPSKAQTQSCETRGEPSEGDVRESFDDQNQASEQADAKYDDWGLFGGPGDGVDGTGSGNMFAGHSGAGKRRGRRRRRAGADGICRDGGKAAGQAVSDAVGRSPIELWNASDFQACAL